MALYWTANSLEAHSPMLFANFASALPL